MNSNYKTVYKSLVLKLIFTLLSVSGIADEMPRVFVFTDINIDAGDPDDRQSLVHLLWYANELRIEGIVPDRWNARGLEACRLVADAYAKDYKAYSFHKKGYPAPSSLEDIVAKDSEHASLLFSTAVSDTSSPLYVLIWGDMKLFESILSKQPESYKNMRLITIGTGLMLEEDIKHLPANWEKSAPCQQLNWNGFGRNEVFDNQALDEMWWLEINWTYAGMFSGEGPKQMFDTLSVFGNMGKHIKEVVKNESWAQYFRVGDTPSVLYLIDANHSLNDPTQSSWAGMFVKPFPKERPNYFTDYHGAIVWDYLNPCATWQNHKSVRDVAVKTLEDRRAEMYLALIDKLTLLYQKP